MPDRSHEYPILTPEPPPPPENTQVEKAKAHPYRTTVIVAAAFLVLFIVVIFIRIGTYGSELGTTWTGAGGVFFTGGRTQTEQKRLTAEDTAKRLSPDVELGYIDIAPRSADNFEDDTGDLEKLLALLTQPKATSSGADVEAAGSYAYIPQGLISIKEGTRAPTKEAQSLAVYGNEVGTYVEGFDAMHGAMAQILKDQAEDRTNADKKAALKRLGQDLAQLGYDLTVMNPELIPEDAKAAHKAYATTYRILGTNLIRIADAATDEEYLNAITTYNGSADSLTNRFLVLVALFSANNVVFSSNDPGRIFMFTQQASF